jgi:hypothetical protein
MIKPGQLVEVSFIGVQTKIGLFIKYNEIEEVLPLKTCSILIDEEIKIAFTNLVKAL